MSGAPSGLFNKLSLGGKASTSGGAELGDKVLNDEFKVLSDFEQLDTLGESGVLPPHSQRARRWLT